MESIQEATLKTVFKPSSLKSTTNPSYKKPRIEEAVVNVPDKKKINQVSLASVALSSKKVETLDEILAKMDKNSTVKAKPEMEYSGPKVVDEEPLDRNEVIWKGKILYLLICRADINASSW